MKKTTTGKEIDEKAEKFIPHGLYEIPFKKNPGGTRVEKAEIDKFWKNEKVKKYYYAKGCYILCLNVTNGTLPVYIGKTINSFGKECFTSHKLDLLNSSFTDYPSRYTPSVMFLIPKKRRGKTNSKAIDALESYLISIAKERNSELKNTKKLKGPEWEIEGINVPKASAGKPTRELRALKNILGL